MAEGICDYWALPHALHSEIRPNSSDCQVSNLHFHSIKKCNFIQHLEREQDFHIPVQCLNPGYIFWVIKKLRTTSPQCQGDFGGLWNSLTCWCFVQDIGPCSDMNCPVTTDPPKCDCSPHVLTLEAQVCQIMSPMDQQSSMEFSDTVLLTPAEGLTWEPQLCVPHWSDKITSFGLTSNLDAPNIFVEYPSPMWTALEIIPLEFDYTFKCCA